MSRLRFCPQWDFQTVTPKIQFATSKMMSRPQAAPQSFQPYRNLKIPGCNTLKINPGRDLESMSRPQTVHPKSQRGLSCHDLGLLTPNLTKVTTPKRMSRHQLLQSRSRRHNYVATSPCLAQIARALPLSWARAGAVVRAAARAAVPTLRTSYLPVTTSTLGRDPVLEIGSSHSSCCLAHKFFYFLFFKASSSFPAAPRMQ